MVEYKHIGHDEKPNIFISIPEKECQENERAREGEKKREEREGEGR